MGAQGLGKFGNGGSGHGAIFTDGRRLPIVPALQVARVGDGDRAFAVVVGGVIGFWLLSLTFLVLVRLICVVRCLFKACLPNV